MHLREFRELLDHQAGAISRRQLIAGGATDDDVRRWVRWRELRRVHRGVFVNHTGPLTWSNRAWAAVLFHWPAALSHESAVNRAGDVIHVAISAERTATRLTGVRVHRLVDVDDRVLWNTSPPRVRVEDALLSLCARSRNRSEALAVLSDACRRRLTTVPRLAAELRRRPKVRHRGWLLSVLQEVADGVHSLLESAYRRRVERAHGLPRGDRQERRRTEDGVIYRDVTLPRFGIVIELDGRIGHELSKDRWDDQDRDLLAAAEEQLTLRLGWRHCEQTPCRTAARLARVFLRRGWRGRPRACSDPGCPITVEFRAVTA